MFFVKQLYGRAENPHVLKYNNEGAFLQNRKCGLTLGIGKKKINLNVFFFFSYIDNVCFYCIIFLSITLSDDSVLPDVVLCRKGW